MMIIGSNHYQHSSDADRFKQKKDLTASPDLSTSSKYQV